MAIEEDVGDANMQCTNHPFNNSTSSHGGGICAFCLQEKLGKLVSSSYTLSVFPSSSSSSTPSFRSDFSAAASANQQESTATNDCHYHRRSRIPFVLTHKKKKKKDLSVITTNSASDQNSIVFKRSKSTVIPRTRAGHFLGSDYADGYSTQKRRFWSFLYSSKNSTTTKVDNPNSKDGFYASNGSFSHQRSAEKMKENGSPNAPSFDRKVSRSRSVGCGSRSFSGDFFERISTGFGDCTLRRVESQREGKTSRVLAARGGVGQNRVKCGGLFSGFTITSSSSSSSSSSYWVSSSTDDNVNGRRVPAPPRPAGQFAHRRSKSWGWAFASPIRAFSKPSSKREAASNKNNAPNLAAIPSLLAARS